MTISSCFDSVYLPGIRSVIAPKSPVKTLISVSELLHLIEQYPSLLRRPIIIDAKRMQIGFNEDEIRAFLPRSYRKQELKEARMRAGIS